MPLRPCLDCGTPANGSRCPRCQAIRNRRRDAQRGTTAQRGLAGAHARISRRFKELDLPCACTSPACPDHQGAVCGRRGTKDNPITAGHIIPRAKGGTSDPDNYLPECRTCNSRKGAR